MQHQSIFDRIMGKDEVADKYLPDELDEPILRRHKKTIFWVSIGTLFLAIAAIVPFFLNDMHKLVTIFSDGSRAENHGMRLSPFSDHASQAKLTTCDKVFPELGQLVTEGAKYKIQSQWNQKSPNDHLISSVSGLDYTTQDYTGPAAAIVLAAPLKAACEGAAIRIVPFPKSCEKAQASLPEGSTLENNLGSISIYRLSDGSGQIILIPASTGCVVTTLVR